MSELAHGVESVVGDAGLAGAAPLVDAAGEAAPAAAGLAAALAAGAVALDAASTSSAERAATLTGGSRRASASLARVA